MEEIIVTYPENVLDDFDALNASEKENGKKVPWDQRVKLIREKFPSTASLNWYEVFRQDSQLLGRLVNDILKVDQASPGRPGKRPALDVQQAEERLRQITGEDYTVLPFQEAFTALKGTRSVRHMAAKTGLNRNLVHDLLRGKIDPRMDVIEQVAKAYGKSPAFFVEYRLYYILAMIYYRLEDQPDASVIFYRRLSKGV